MGDAATDLWKAVRGTPDRPVIVSPRTGGPAGNTRLTAWFGVALLCLLVVQIITLTDILGMMKWHVAVGLLLIPPSLAKVASTGWRIVRYYTRTASFRKAGPPPLLLRLLGPVLILSTLSVLATGLVVLWVGQLEGDRPVYTLFGSTWSAKDMHQASYSVWIFAAGFHVLARLVTALKTIGLARSSATGVPGGAARSKAMLATASTAVALAIVAYPTGHSWTAGTIRLVASDQSVDSSTVVIDDVNLQGAAAGWVVVQVDNGGTPGRTIGIRRVVEGRVRELKVPLSERVSTDVFWATLHVDDHIQGSYENQSDATADAPIRIGSDLIRMRFQVVAP